MEKLLITADFETTVCEDPEVYSWAMYYSKNNETIIKYGISVKSFLEEVKSFKENIEIYFHNGAKFDSKFIFPALYEVGLRERPYTVSKKVLKVLKPSDWKDNHIGERGRYLESGEFDYFADGTKKTFNIKIGLNKRLHRKIEDGVKPKCKTASILDSNLLFPGSIKSYGESLNNHYGTTLVYLYLNNIIKTTTPYNKGETGRISYDRVTLYNSVEELENDGNELEYLIQDCRIAYEFLTLMNKTLPRKWWKTTAAGTAYNYWKHVFGVQLEEEAIKSKRIFYYQLKDGYKLIKEVGIKKPMQTNKWRNKEIKKLFPVKWLDERDNKGLPLSLTVNEYYNGGLSFINPRFKGIKLKDVETYDLNSAYPSVMAGEELLPYGAPVKGDGGKNYPCKLIKVWSRTELINKEGLPFLFKKGTDETKIYSKIIPPITPFYLTNYEFERFQKYYTGEYEYSIYLSFKGVSGDFLFGRYIKEFYTMKSEGKKENNAAKTTIAKLFLNALYGKFGTKTTREGKIYNFDTHEWELTRDIEKAGYFLPMAAFITAQTRMKLVDAVDFNYKNTIGGDTDSIFVLRNKEFHKFNFDIDEYKLGAWKLEFKGKGVFKRTKQYFLKSNKDYKGKVVNAGFNWDREGYENIENLKDVYNKKLIGKEYILTIIFLENYISQCNYYLKNIPDINNFCTELYAENQLQPFQFKSGVQLRRIRKWLKPIWEDKKHEEDWYNDENSYYKNYHLILRKY